jgi:phosphoribosylpyrophosphate synthetase
MSQAPMTTIKLEDWPLSIPIDWFQFVDCEIFHKKEGWFTIDKVEPGILWVSDQQGVEDGVVFENIRRDILKVRVPSDSEIINSYKDVHGLGRLSLKFDLSYKRLVKAHAADSKKLGNILRKMRDRKTPDREELNWFQDYFSKQEVASRFPPLGGLKKITDKNSITITQKKVNHVGSFIVGYIDDYYPKRMGIEHAPTERILDFKRGDRSTVDYYTAKVLPHVKKGVVLCCAPSSNKGEWGQGLVLLLEKLAERVPCVSYTDLICRTVDTEKRSLGGDRSIEVNVGTMEVINPEKCKDKDVIVLDDIVTTGGTMCACAKLVWEAQAASVSGVTMGKTIDTRGKENHLGEQQIVGSNEFAF